VKGKKRGPTARGSHRLKTKERKRKHFDLQTKERMTQEEEITGHTATKIFGREIAMARKESVTQKAQGRDTVSGRGTIQRRE